MFERFLSTFAGAETASGPFPEWKDSDTVAAIRVACPTYSTFMRTCARTTFAEGALRFLAPDAVRRWNGPQGWGVHWRDWAGELGVVAIDWRGNLIGLDRVRQREGHPLIGIVDIGAAEYLEVPTTFEEFLESELIDSPDRAIASEMFRMWRQKGGASPAENECVGYVQPLFLGGDDSLTNMRITDLEVYVDIHGQLYEKCSSMRPGTKIGGFSIDD